MVFLLFFDLYCLTPAVNEQIFISTEGLPIPIGTSTSEENAETETQPPTETRKCSK